MALQAAFFYLFSAVLIFSAIMVIWAKNPVHSVLFLILSFFNAAGLFILVGAEFLALILLIVYVGAVAVLFLFVVMMLDVDFAELKAGFMKNAPLGLLVGVVLAVELIGFLALRLSAGSELLAIAAPTAPTPVGVTNTEALGQILYTKYVYFFQASGVILLISMIGAIVLTLRHKEGVKRQDAGEQVRRSPRTAVAKVQVASGEGPIPDAEPIQRKAS